jgi:hypothetical protein
MSVDVIQIFAACTGSGICLETLPQTSADSPFIQNVISVAIAIIAAVSVLFIAIGGLRYILSQGDPQAVSKAKGSVVYALIGLAIAIIAQAIVIFVVKGIT